MQFSQRIGVLPQEELVQIERIDDDLKNSLWNALTIVYFQRVEFSASSRHDITRNSNLFQLMQNIWLHFFKEPVDQMPRKFSDTVKYLRQWFYKEKWYRVFDFVEHVAVHGPSKVKSDFVNICNHILDRENSAYRFVNGVIAEITCQEEVSEVESAITNTSINSGAKKHLQSALSLMSDKIAPDYRNAIKESISAVESIARYISNDDRATLGKALKAIEQDRGLHPALKAAFSSLYEYTNDADGIRHALMKEDNLTKADARFMLVICSAFSNYLVESCLE